MNEFFDLFGVLVSLESFGNAKNGITGTKWDTVQQDTGFTGRERNDET